MYPDGEEVGLVASAERRKVRAGDVLLTAHITCAPSLEQLLTPSSVFCSRAPDVYPLFVPPACAHVVRSRRSRRSRRVRRAGRVAPRSGLSWKKHIDVGAGVIDSDYRGNVGVVLFNHGEEDLTGACVRRVKRGNATSGASLTADLSDGPPLHLIPSSCHHVITSSRTPELLSSLALCPLSVFFAILTSSLSSLIPASFHSVDR